MEWKNVRKLALALVIAAAPACADEQQIISVVGEGKVAVKATVANVVVGVEAQETSAEEVQKKLATLSKSVMAALQALEAEKVETGAIYIHPQYRSGTKPPTIAGFRGNIRLSFSTPVENAGLLIEAAFQAGANQMHSISLKPKEDILKQAREEALKKACNHALAEASIVLSTLGLQPKKIQKITITPYHQVTPVFRSFANAKALTTEFDITEQEQDVPAEIALEIQVRSRKDEG